MIKFLFLDSPSPWQLGFQDPATPVIIGIIHFHNHLIFFLVGIGIFVVWLLVRALILFSNSHKSTKASKFTHSTPLEIVWTITPAFLLLLIAGPSFALLYSIDEVIAPHISLKVIGHQWYWSYEYSDYVNNNTGKNISFDSYIIAEEDLSFGGLRLLEVDNRVKLPTKVHIRVLVSGADVLHSWAVPSLGVKIDACPGRLNQVSLFLLRSGVFYGQCSEICGVNHAFIPIVVESIDENLYIDWVKTNLLEDDVRVNYRKVFDELLLLENHVLETHVSSDKAAVDYKLAFDNFLKENNVSLNPTKPKHTLNYHKLFYESLYDRKSDGTYKPKASEEFLTYIHNIEKKILCPPYPQVEFFERFATLSEQKACLNHECNVARAFLVLYDDHTNLIQFTREAWCKKIKELYLDHFLFHKKGTSYYHNHDVTCEEITYLLGGDPFVLKVIDENQKAQDDAFQILYKLYLNKARYKIFREEMLKSFEKQAEIEKESTLIDNKAITKVKRTQK